MFKLLTIILKLTDLLLFNIKDKKRVSFTLLIDYQLFNIFNIYLYIYIYNNIKVFVYNIYIYYNNYNK